MEVIFFEDINDILSFRREKNLELYMKDLGDYGEFFIQPSESILFRSRALKTLPEIQNILPYVNKPIIFRDKRLVSHNFLSTETWSSSADSKWIAEPDDGYKMVVTSIQVRFPKDIKLTDENPLYFKVHLYHPSYDAVVPVIDLQYTSVRDLAKKSNNPLVIPPNYTIDNLSSKELVEIEFRYADPYTLKGTPITIHSSKNEYIEIGVLANKPFKNIDDFDYDDTTETWCVVNGKQIYDF